MQINATNAPADVSLQVRQKTEIPVSAQTEASKIEIRAETRPEKFDKQENLSRLKEVLAESNITLKFRRDEETKAMVVELVDDKTGEAIRQIPSEISLKLTAVFVKMQGQFIDKKE